MARFKIISKDGGTIRYEGKPKYVGTYLRPSYLEFSEIASSVPIAWEVGDYVEYSRTGMTYRLYSIPQATKNARKGSHGRAFTYSGVQLFAATKELDIALFRDLVSNDNNIHFSTSPDVVTFEDVYGIARRIQECMDDLYPGRWEIRVADFDESEDAEIISKISEAKDFALSGGTCLDALSKIYELWQDVGWIHSHENGKEVITIGYTSKRIDANTSESYLYGKGNGLTAIKKTQINRDEFATRLYVYGSERNLPSRYYNTKGILNADSVDIRNLMLPLDKWGMTDNLPDARKAYLENAEAVARFGVIPKTHYFDSEDAGADIYPSISGMTIGMLRKVLDDMGQTKYYPSESDYPDPSQRIDEVRFCYNPEDDGAINIEPIRHSEHEFAEMSEGVVSSTQFIVDNKFLFSEEFTLEEGKACEMVVSPHISGYVEDRGYSLVVVSLRLQDSRYTSSIGHSAVQKAYAKKDGDRWTFDLPEVRFNYAQSPIRGFGCKVYITIEGNGASNENSAYILNAGTVDFSLYPIQSETFVIRLNELGFNIDEMAKVGNGKTISMKTGACAGRSFKIEKSRHMSSYSYWDITCRRQKDSTLGQIFPNSSYQIQAGDKFVLVDIGMPESYIRVAMERLLSEGEKLLSRASKIQNHYEPSIDAKVMMESGRTLREGMFMEITDEDVVDNTTDYILIDSLSIIEDESSIPTYKVTLKERRKVTYKGTPSATSTTDTQTSVGGSENEEGFATETFVTEQINILKGLWHIDESTGYLVTDHQVHIKKSLLIDGDVASGGEGENTPAEGTVTRIDVDGTPYNPDSLGVIDLTEAFKNVKVDLSNYYTKYEVNELIDEIKAGDIDLANYYTKEEIDRKGFLTSASLVGYAKTTDVDAVVDRVELLEDAGYATTGYVSEAISDLNIGQFATKTALSATVEALSAEIGKKANADDVADTYATKTALSTLQSSHNTLRSEFDALNDALNDDVSGKINTWNEIVDFVNEYSGSEDLATIISKINADIAKRAFQSDLTALATRVGTAEGNITSLTNGKADKATTLAGYGITNAYTKGETDSLLGKYVLLEKASQTIKGDITIEGNLVITGDVASGGEGGNTSAEGTVTGVTVSGVDYTSVEAGLLDLTDLMALYALKSDSTKVSVSPSLSSGKSIGVISVDGVGTTLYAPATYAWSEITGTENVLLKSGTSSQFLKADGSLDSSSYLPLSGGTITAYDSPLALASTSARVFQVFKVGTSNKGSVGYANGLMFISNDAGNYARIGVNDSGIPQYWSNNNVSTAQTLLHSGNYSNYALPLSGGTITGASGNYTPLIIKTTSLSEVWIAFEDTVGVTHIGSARGVPSINSGNGNHTLIHSGNVGDYAALSYGEIGANSVKGNASGYTYATNGGKVSGGFISAGLSSYGFQLNGNDDAGADELYYRGYTPNGYNTWKTIAFTDSTVAAAKKIVTSAGADAVTIGSNGLELHSGYVAYKDGDAYRYLGPQGSQKKLRFYDSTEWKDIAFTDSNVASATKLQTARTIWGQSFDGTGDVDGSLSLGNDEILGGASSVNMLYYDKSNTLYLGYGMCGVGGSVICGNAIAMRYGSSRDMGFLLNSSGNVTIGASDLARTSAKLLVDGDVALRLDVYGGSGNVVYRSLSFLGAIDKRGGLIRCGINDTYSHFQSLEFGSYDNPTMMLINSSGNVLIGTTTDDGSGAKLQVTGNAISITDTQATYEKGAEILFKEGGRGYLGAIKAIYENGNWNADNIASASLRFYTCEYTSPIERMRIAANGNVGIGTPDPQYKLDVVGTGRFTDSLLVSGTLTANSGATITGDVTINGNLIVSGDVASGGQGQDTPSGGSTSTSGVLTLTGEIPQGSNIPQSSLDAIGLTDQVIADLLIGKYHHVMYTSGITTYCFVVSGQYNSAYKAFTLHWGDDYMDEFMGYSFSLGSSGGWYISFYEI